MESILLGSGDWSSPAGWFKLVTEVRVPRRTQTNLWTFWAQTLWPGQQAAGERLARQWQQDRGLRQPARELLALEDGAAAWAAAALVQARPSLGPARTEADSRWMNRGSFAFVNVRATGLGDTHGHWVQAAKLLLGLRVQALHLAPFTEHEFGTVYAVKSWRTPNPDLVHMPSWEAGFDPFYQIEAFVQLAHSLGMAVGFDLEPHVAQFAYPVLQNPRAWRWIKVYPQDRQHLDDWMTPETVYQEEHQQRLAEQVEQMVRKIMKNRQVEDLDLQPGDSPFTLRTKKLVGREIVMALIERGFWTVPSHAWDGYGLPAFDGYHQDGYARFAYRNRPGEDVARKAWHIVTPLKFYRHLPLQGHAPERDPEPEPLAWDLYASVFSPWRRLGFDFVRHDSVDHIFDSCEPGQGDRPLSDRPTPRVLAEVIRRSREEGGPAIGHLAERMGDEVEAYAGLGYDTILGSAMLWKPGPDLVRYQLDLNHRLTALNSSRPESAAVTWAVDSHDTGDPGLLGASVIEREGPTGLILRLALARFFQWQGCRRPKYEVMGLSDLTPGLYPANVKRQNLPWTGDADMTRLYHGLEDLYDFLAPEWTRARLVQARVEGTGVWWLLADGETRLAGHLAWEGPVEGLPDFIAQAAPGRLWEAWNLLKLERLNLQRPDQALSGGPRAWVFRAGPGSA